MDRQAVFITGHGRKIDIPFFRTGESLEIRSDKSFCQLPRPVGTEIKEDDAVPVGNGLMAEDGRHDKLIGNASCIGITKAGLGIGRFDTFTKCYGLVCFFRAVPAVIPVHGIIAATDRRDGTCTETVAFVFQRL